MRAAGEEQTAFRHLAAGRGVIFALPHMGNWEHAGAWIVLRGAGNVTTVAERLRPESLYDRFVAFRERLGMEVLPHSAGAPQSRPGSRAARRDRPFCARESAGWPRSTESRRIALWVASDGVRAAEDLHCERGMRPAVEKGEPAAYDASAAAPAPL